MGMGPAPDRQPVTMVKGCYIIKGTVGGIRRHHNERT